jgi:hypothetical protein
MAKLGVFAGALAEQPGVQVDGRGMLIILALLAMEAPLGIASAPAAVTRARRWMARNFSRLAGASVGVPSTEKCLLNKSFPPAAG